MSARRADRRGCSEFHNHLQTLDRRSVLKLGMLGATGLTLNGLLRGEAQATSAGRSPSGLNSVILLWMRGGPSQHETWDPKPLAPLEFRGAFGAMETNVPGIQICDLLPLSARVMDKWSVIRSLHHHDAGHSSADQLCFTGYNSGPNPDVNHMPSFGSVVARQLQDQSPELPASVMIPRMVPGTGSSFLGPACDPFETQADPANTGPFQIRGFQVPQGLSLARVGARRELLGDLDRLRGEVDQSGQMEALDKFQQRAWEMVTSSKAQEAFNLDAEPQAVRERYGFTPPYVAPTPDRCGVPAWSQRFLLARRLVEAGVRLVTVDCRWWDTHVQGIETMRDGFLPRWDQAYSALIQDLAERGLLETTMVLAWGEFGRTPRINKDNGRDHYPNVFSAALAGGGIQGGRVVGSSDTKGAFPKDNPKTPQDVLATVYRHLGVDTHVHYTDAAGRPHPVLPSGQPVEELF